MNVHNPPTIAPAVPAKHNAALSSDRYRASQTLEATVKADCRPLFRALAADQSRVVRCHGNDASTQRARSKPLCLAVFQSNRMSNDTIYQTELVAVSDSPSLSPLKGPEIDFGPVKFPSFLVGAGEYRVCTLWCDACLETPAIVVDCRWRACSFLWDAIFLYSFALHASTFPCCCVACNPAALPSPPSLPWRLNWTATLSTPGRRVPSRTTEMSARESP